MTEVADLGFDPTQKKKKSKKEPIVLDDMGLEQDENVDFSKMKKKKKRPAVKPDQLEGEEETAAEKDEDGKSAYSYDDLLKRVFAIMKERNPNVGEKKPFVMRPPEVVRAGTKKSSFVNFLDSCKSMKREPAHVRAFILAELGTRLIFLQCETCQSRCTVSNIRSGFQAVTTKRAATRAKQV